MVKVQVDIPEDVNTELKVFSIRNKISDKRDSIIKILRERLIK